VQEVHKYLPKSIATTMGHLDQQRQNLQSTKRKHKPNQTEDKEGIDTNPEKAAPTNTGFANLIELTEPTQKSYSDLTGCFPLHSSHGNLYVLVLYLYHSYAILVEPLKNRSGSRSRHTPTYYNISPNTNNPGHIGWTTKLQLPSNECWWKNTA
jgi:hypothetical protein